MKTRKWPLSTDAIQAGTNQTNWSSIEIFFVSDSVFASTNLDCFGFSFAQIILCFFSSFFFLLLATFSPSLCRYVCVCMFQSTAIFIRQFNIYRSESTSAPLFVNFQNENIKCATQARSDKIFEIRRKRTEFEKTVPSLLVILLIIYSDSVNQILGTWSCVTCCITNKIHTRLMHVMVVATLIFRFMPFFLLVSSAQNVDSFFLRSVHSWRIFNLGQ